MRTNELLQVYSWLKANQKALDLKVYKREWQLPFSDLLPKYYSCSYITINGKSHFGLSVHADQLACQAISAIEAYERAYMSFSGIKNSNGCAIHTDESVAVTNAQNELMERDAYLRFHFLGSAFQKVSLPQNTLISACSKELAALGIDLSFGLIGENQYGKACIAIADGRKRAQNPFGLMIGLGFEPSLMASLNKSLYEILRFVDGTYSPNFPIEALSFEDFSITERAGVHEHIGLGLDIEYANFLSSHYRPKPEKIKLRNSQTIKEQSIPFAPKFKNNVSRANIDGLPECPLYFCHSQSEDLINIEFGNNHGHNFLHGKIPEEKLLKYKNQIAYHILG